MTPENRGIFRLPFKVNLNGQTEAYTGSVTTGAIQCAGDDSRVRCGY